MARFSGSTYSAAVDESKRLIALAMLGITNYDFDKTTNKLTLYMQDGTVVEAALTADSSSGEQNTNLQSLIDDTIITTTKTNSSSKIHMDIQAAIAECKDDTLKQIANLQSLIDDVTITTTKTNSSSKIHMDIQAAIAECKDDTLKQIAKKVTGSYKIATSTAEVTSADHIYLINNGSNYDLYVLVDSTPTKVGDTSIDLSDYAKTSDLSEYLKSSDADGKFATITTVDNHIDDADIHVTKELKDKLVTTDDIATTIDSSSTDDTVAGALTTYNTIKRLMPYITSSVSSEDPDITTKALIRIRHDNAPTSDSEYFILTFFTDDTLEIVEKSQMAFNIGTNATYTRTKKYNSAWSGWTKILTNDNITTTIDSSSTNDTVPSAKALYSALDNQVDKRNILGGTDADTLIKEGKYYLIAGTNMPDNYGWINVLEFGTYSVQIYYPSLGDFNMYIRRMQDGVAWSPWQRVCSTTVADVANTKVSTNDSFTSTNDIQYFVENGKCTLKFEASGLSYASDTTTSWVKITDDILPRAKMGVKFPIACMPSGKSIVCTIDTNNENLKIYGTIPSGTTAMYGSTTYPVAE